MPTEPRGTDRVRVSGSAMGVFSARTGELVFGSDGAEVMALVPGKEQVVLVRTEVKADAQMKGAARADLRWLFERVALPSGELLSRVVLAGPETGGWPSMLKFPKKDRGRMVTLVCGDESGSYRLYFELRDEGDRRVGSPSERKGDEKVVPPEQEASKVVTPPERLAELARQSDALALVVAKNPAAPSGVIASLARSPDARVREAVAAHPEITDEITSALLSDSEPAVRAALARVRTSISERKRFQLPHSVFEALARDPDASVRAAAAAGFFPDLHAILASDADPTVRLAVAKRPVLSPEVERALAEDARAEVRLTLVQSRHEIDAHALLRLVDDRSAKVRERAARLRARQSS